MKITLTQRDMLKRFRYGPQSLIDFTTAKNNQHVMKPDLVQKNLNGLEKLGMIENSAYGYSLTTAGKKVLDGEFATPPQPAYEVYVPAEWRIRAGAGELSLNGRAA
ncbi:MAG: hypothetical protein V4772_08900 [Pseudomonadota bacterium]